MIYDCFKLEISVISQQDCCHSLIVVKTHIVLLQICQGDTCTENWETMRGFAEIGTNQAGKKSLVLWFRKKILLNHKASWHSFGMNATRDQAQTLKYQHCEAAGVVSGMIMAQGKQHSPKQRFRS